jgi:hypothetical protein
MFQGRPVTNRAILQDDFLAMSDASLRLDRRCWTGAIQASFGLPCKPSWTCAAPIATDAPKPQMTPSATRESSHPSPHHTPKPPSCLLPTATSSPRLFPQARSTPLASSSGLSKPGPKSITAKRMPPAAAIHCTHEHLTHCFCCRHKTKTTNPDHPSARQLPSTAPQPNKADQERPGLI